MDRTYFDRWHERRKHTLPGVLDFAFEAPEPGIIHGRFTVAEKHMSSNGYLHAGTAVTFADTACGLGAMTNRPSGAEGFTTVELKANFLGTAKIGDTLEVTARLVHGGRTTQVWDAEVVDAPSGRKLSVFRCTQMLFYPK